MINKIYLKCRQSILLLSLLICCLYTIVSAKSTNDSIFFSYQELTTLYEQEISTKPLEIKLNYLLTTPFIDNSYKNLTPVRLSNSPNIGEFLRVAHWNIERGLEYKAIEAIFSSEAKFTAFLDLDKEKFPLDSKVRSEMLEQAKTLREADIIILNEVDWGMKRSGYRNIVADLAKTLEMNYAFGVQFVELTPIHLSQEPVGADSDKNKVLDIIKVDPARYRGLHGIAILSRFPLENVRLIPFKNQPYDWYKSEKKGASMLEKGRREITKRVFLEKTLREVRRGGRSMLLADIADIRFPSGRVTIVATHLENRTEPSNRIKQLKELLGEIKDIQQPVIVAGDMNTSTEDLTPTSFSHEFKKRFGKPDFWINQGISYALSFGIFENFVINSVTFWRKQSDPTVRSIPFIAPNHEKKFFTTLKEFRFNDGNSFDFRGDPTRSTGNHNDLLANSNERGGKGFITTYQVTRPIKFVGRYKLDWIFVKPTNLINPKDTKGSYFFAPHFGRTLAAVNKIVEGRVSDHRPLTVDLPLTIPAIE